MRAVPGSGCDGSDDSGRGWWLRQRDRDLDDQRRQRDLLGREVSVRAQVTRLTIGRRLDRMVPFPSFRYIVPQQHGPCTAAAGFGPTRNVDAAAVPAGSNFDADTVGSTARRDARCRPCRSGVGCEGRLREMASVYDRSSASAPSGPRSHSADGHQLDKPHPRSRRGHADLPLYPWGCSVTIDRRFDARARGPLRVPGCGTSAHADGRDQIEVSRQLVRHRLCAVSSSAASDPIAVTQAAAGVPPRRTHRLSESLSQRRQDSLEVRARHRAAHRASRVQSVSDLRAFLAQTDYGPSRSGR